MKENVFALTGWYLALPAKQHCQFSQFSRFLGEWAKLAVLFSWQLQNGPQDFDFFNCHGCRIFILYESHCYLSPPKSFLLCSKHAYSTHQRFYLATQLNEYDDYIAVVYDNKKIQNENATPKMYGMCTILLVLCLPAALAFKYPKRLGTDFGAEFFTQSPFMSLR